MLKYVALFVLALPIAARAEMQPIMLSAPEYMAVMEALAQRDELMRFMMTKQKAAQDAAARPAPTPAPMLTPAPEITTPGTPK